MKNSASVHNLSYDYQATDTHTRCVASHLSEQDIIELHATFLTNGFQHITLSDAAAGRALLYTITPLLSYYYSMAALTVDDEPLPTSVFDLYSSMICGGYLNPYSQPNDELLTDFFLEQLSSTFLWIEATQQLRATRWYRYFEQKLIELRFDQHMPIIIVSYRDTGA